MFAPEAEYERHGDVQDVVFPRGYTVASDGDTINIYYGAAVSLDARNTRRWYSERLIVTQQALVWWLIAVAPLRIRSLESNSAMF